MSPSTWRRKWEHTLLQQPGRGVRASVWWSVSLRSVGLQLFGILCLARMSVKEAGWLISSQISK